MVLGGPGDSLDRGDDVLLALRESEDLDEIIPSTFRWELVSSGEGADTSYVSKKKYLLIICSSYNIFGVKNADY